MIFQHLSAIFDISASAPPIIPFSKGRWLAQRTGCVCGSAERNHRSLLIGAFVFMHLCSLCADFEAPPADETGCGKPTTAKWKRLCRKETPIPFDRCFRAYSAMFSLRRFRGLFSRRNRARLAGDSRAAAALPKETTDPFRSVVSCLCSCVLSAQISRPFRTTKSGATSWRQPSGSRTAARLPSGSGTTAYSLLPRTLISSLSKNATALKPAASSVPSCLPSFLACGRTVTL